MEMTQALSLPQGGVSCVEICRALSAAEQTQQATQQITHEHIWHLPKEIDFRRSPERQDCVCGNSQT